MKILDNPNLSCLIVQNFVSFFFVVHNNDNFSKDKAFNFDGVFFIASNEATPVK